MAGKLQIGAVAYLNTKPLVFGFEQGLAADRIDLHHDVPSGLACRMRDGELDVALLPVIELCDAPDLEIVPGLAIGTAGPSRSVLLVSRVPVEEVRSVALDPESRTSNALTRVAFGAFWHGAPVFETGAADLETSLERWDAAVRIGDKALFETPPTGTHVYDLGEVWSRETGLPFVYAAWIARPGRVDRTLYQAFHESRRRGSRALDRIAAAYVWRGQTYPEISRDYLARNIRYRMGSPEVDGLRLFLRLAAEHGVVAAVPALRFVFERWTTCHEAAAAGAAVRHLTDEVPHV